MGTIPVVAVGSLYKISALRGGGWGIAESLLPDLSILLAESCHLASLDQDLNDLAQLAPHPKRQLITAGDAALPTGGKVTAREGERLRGICDALGCPMPPMLPGQSAA